MDHGHTDEDLGVVSIESILESVRRVGIELFEQSPELGNCRWWSKSRAATRNRIDFMSMTRQSTDSDLTEHEKSVLMRLEASGWFVNNIASDKDGPGFAYSFGLYGKFEHPEIILFGLSPSTMGSLINGIGEHAKNGLRYTDGDTTTDLLEDYVCRFQHVDPRWYSTTLTWAGWFYKNWDFPALQLVWPDRAGVLPWDRNCVERVRNIQPDLSRPPKHH